jgi:hypothetical protein
LVFLAALVLWGAGYGACASCFNSDDLYLVELCDYILNHGPNLVGWHLPPAPYLFPDLPLLLGCRLFVSNLAVLFLAYAVLFYSLLAVVLAWMGRECGLPWSRSFVVSLLGLALLFASHLDGTYPLQSVLLYKAGSHMGALLIGLFTVAQIARALRRGWSRLAVALTIAVVSLGVLSDRLLIVQFLAPLSVALGGAALRRLVGWKMAAGTVLLLAVSVVLSVLFRAGLTQGGVETVDISRRMPAASALWPLARDLCLAVVRLFQANPFHLYLLGLHSTATLVVGLLLARRGRRGQEGGPGRQGSNLVVALSLLLCLPCNVAGVLLTALTNPCVLILDRYFLAGLVLPFVTLGLLSFALGPRAQRAVVGLLGLVVGVLVVNGVRKAPPVAERLLQPPYPALARAVDQLVLEQGHKQGLAGYWTARRIHYLSRTRPPLGAILPNGGPMLHSGHPSQYLPPEADSVTRIAPSYIVLTPGAPLDPDPAQIVAEFGEPVEKRVVGSTQIWLYPAVHGPRFDRFLGAVAESLYRRTWRTAGPVAPVQLALPKGVAARCRARNTLPLRPGESVEIRFAGPVRGDLIDVSGYAYDQYRVTFFKGSEALGQLAIPSVEWPVTLCRDPGLHARLQPLPPGLAGRTWDRVVLTAGDTHPHPCLGHFLVLTAPGRGGIETSETRREGHDAWPQ